VDTAASVKQIKNSPAYQDQVVRGEQLPARRARKGRQDRPLPPILESALRGVGADQRYAHLAQAMNATRQVLQLCQQQHEGRDV
jgi:hypothetical protein